MTNSTVELELQLRNARKEIAQLQGQRETYVRLCRTVLLREMRGYAALIAQEAAGTAVVEDDGHRMATAIQLLALDEPLGSRQLESLRAAASRYYRTSGSWPAERGIASRVRAELDGLLDMLLSDLPVPPDPDPAPEPVRATVRASHRRTASRAGSLVPV